MGDSARSAQLTEEAREQAGRHDSLSPLAILYMTFHGGKGIEGILDSQFLSKDPPVEIPSYTQEGASKENFLLQPDSLLAPPPRTTVYFWQTLPRREFAAKCFGSLYNKSFQNADAFQKWSELRQTNRLVRWAWKGDVVGEDFQELSSDPRKFLEVLLLTNRFFKRPMMGESKRSEARMARRRVCWRSSPPIGATAGIHRHRTEVAPGSSRPRQRTGARDPRQFSTSSRSRPSTQGAYTCSTRHHRGFP